MMEDVWKKFISGEKLACRPLFGKTTEDYQWNRCGKWWECNFAFPSIKGDPADLPSLKSFWRRLVVLELASNFASDVSQIDIEKRVFAEDAALTEFIQSGEAKLCYLQHHLIPFMQTHGPNECKAILRNPPEDIVRNTKRVVSMMANGGVVKPDGWDAEGLQ